MNRLEAWITHIVTVLLTVTGVVYAWMHYLMKSTDPFSLVNHPWEPYMLDIHVLAAPVLILLIGILVHAHILTKLQANGTTARRSGIWLIPTFIVMVLSGYLLQVITASWKSILVVVHLASGLLWFLIYMGHYVSSYRLRKLMKASANFATQDAEPKNGNFRKFQSRSYDNRNSPENKI